MSYNKVLMAIRGPKDCRLKDLPFMTEFQHTGINEQINSLHNVYLPKSCSFGHKQAVVRACLTAIDHNRNVDRKVALDSDGEERYNVVNTRDGHIWTAKSIMQPKNTKWRGEIVDEVLEAVRNRSPPTMEVPTDDHLKRYSNKLPKPEKAVAVEATKKRRRFRDERQANDVD